MYHSLDKTEACRYFKLRTKVPNLSSIQKKNIDHYTQNISNILYIHRKEEEKKMKECVICHTQNDEKSRFCSQCGHDLSITVRKLTLDEKLQNVEKELESLEKEEKEIRDELNKFKLPLKKGKYKNVKIRDYLQVKVDSDTYFCIILVVNIILNLFPISIISFYTKSFDWKAFLCIFIISILLIHLLCRGPTGSVIIINRKKIILTESGIKKFSIMVAKEFLNSDYQTFEKEQILKEKQKLIDKYHKEMDG